MVRVIIEVEADDFGGVMDMLGGVVNELKNGWTAIERTNDECHVKMVLVDPDENDQTAFPVVTKGKGK